MNVVDILAEKLKVLSILEKHFLLNLCEVYDYDSYDDFINEHEGTTNELNYDEWNTLYNWIDNARKNSEKNK